MLGSYGSLVDEEDDEYVYLALGVRGEFEREFNNYLNLRYLLWAEFENTAEPGKKEAVYCYTYWGNENELLDVATFAG